MEQQASDQTQPDDSTQPSDPSEPTYTVETYSPQYMKKMRLGFMIEGVIVWVRAGLMIIIGALEYQLASLWLIAYGLEFALQLIPGIMWFYVGPEKTKPNNIWVATNNWSQIWMWGFLIVHLFWDGLMLEFNNTSVYSVPYMPYILVLDMVVHIVLLVLYYVGWQWSRDYIEYLNLEGQNESENDNSSTDDNEGFGGF